MNHKTKNTKNTKNTKKVFFPILMKKSEFLFDYENI